MSYQLYRTISLTPSQAELLRLVQKLTWEVILLSVHPDDADLGPSEEGVDAVDQDFASIGIEPHIQRIRGDILELIPTRYINIAIASVLAMDNSHPSDQYRYGITPDNRSDYVARLHQLRDAVADAARGYDLDADSTLPSV